MPHKITEENDSVNICDNCINLMEQDVCTSKGCDTTTFKETLKLCEEENGSIRVTVDSMSNLGSTLK